MLNDPWSDGLTSLRPCFLLVFFLFISYKRTISMLVLNHSVWVITLTWWQQRSRHKTRRQVGGARARGRWKSRRVSPSQGRRRVPALLCNTSVSNPDPDRGQEDLPRPGHERAQAVAAREGARETVTIHQCMIRRSRRYETYTKGQIDRSLRLGAGGSKGDTPCAVLDAVYGISPSTSPARGPARAAHVALFDGHCGEKEEEGRSWFCCWD